MGWAVGRLAEVGVTAEQSHSEQRRIRTISAVALVAFVATAFFTVLFLIARPGGPVPLWAYLSLAAIYLAGYALAFVLNMRGHHERAVLLLVETALLNLAAASFTAGFETGPAVFLVTIGMAAVLITSIDSRMVRWGSVALSVVAYAVLVVVDPPASPSIAGTWFVDLLVVATYAGMVAFVVSVVWYQRLLADRAEDALSEANERSERLLLNILPSEIADRLKTDEYPIADRKPAVSRWT